MVIHLFNLQRRRGLIFGKVRPANQNLFVREAHWFYEGATSTMTWQIKMQLHYSYNNENKKKKNMLLPQASRDRHRLEMKPNKRQKN